MHETVLSGNIRITKNYDVFEDSLTGRLDRIYLAQCNCILRYIIAFIAYGVILKRYPSPYLDQALLFYPNLLFQP
jgi:hypothetical protein